MPAPSSPNGRPAASRRPLAVLFDLDGTLIDSIELILCSMRHAFRACGAPAPEDAEWLEGVGIPLPTMFRRYAGSDAALAALIAAYREHQLAHHDRLVRCYDAVADTVSLLRAGGHPLAVVTSKSNALARRGLEHVGLAAFFDTIVGADSCTRHKPHPEPVLTALDRLARPPGEAVFVGDSVHDIAAGNAAGVVTIAALWGPFTRQQLGPAGPRLFLDRISELPGVLAGL
jgi:pyrophosphatase PpaX